MEIDYSHFNPWASLLGGALIGLASGLLGLCAGRIAGISGIVGGILRGLPQASHELVWRIAFIAGLVLAPLLWLGIAPLPAMATNASPTMLICAGLLVGLGTRYANGCTSGHGVCGLSRLSLRSLVAVLVFMAAGFITVFVTHHLS